MPNFTDGDVPLGASSNFGSATWGHIQKHSHKVTVSSGNVSASWGSSGNILFRRDGVSENYQIYEKQTSSDGSSDNLTRGKFTRYIIKY